MPKVKLTVKAVEAARAPEGERTDLFDATLPGFGLRVGASKKTWFIFYRFGGKQRRFNLGSFPALSLADARIKAGAALEKVERGIDPASEREEAAQAACDASAYRLKTGFYPGSFGDIASRYIKAECESLRRGKDVESVIIRELQPTWKDRQAADLRRKDLTALLDPIIATGQVQRAHKVREIGIRVINWAIDHGDLEDNLLASPSRGRKRSGILRRTKRARYLSDEELAEVWHGCSEEDGPFQFLVKVLLLTGQRLNEVAAMRRAELDLQAGVWTISPDRYKTGIYHLVPLTDAAKALVREAPEVSKTFVFATQPDTYFQGHAKYKVRMIERINKRRAESGRPPMEHWTLHDLRRTLRTGLAELQVLDPIAERVLGHVIGGIEGVYNRWAYLEEKRQALQLWADRIDRLVNPPPSAEVAQSSNVVHLNARR